MILVPGFDRRWHWSDVPAWLAVLAELGIAASFVVFFYVMKQNSYAAATVRVEAGQPVISTGLYGIVRHPMYMGALPLMIAMPLALGSYWALLLALAIVPVLAWRLLDEERVLRRDLPGYADYCRARALAAHAGRVVSRSTRPCATAPLRLLQILERLAGHLRIFELEPVQRLHQRRRHHHAREPLVVGRHHVPRRFGAAGLADRFLVGRHVFRPQLALGDVAQRELPALVRLVDAVEEALALFLARDVEEELEDQRAVAREMLLEGADIVEAVLPDVLAAELSRQPLSRRAARDARAPPAPPRNASG